MKLLNAKILCDQAAEQGFGIPALNNNGGSYDIGRAIIESCEELRSPLIIQEYEPNLEYRGFDFAGQLIRTLAADTTIPMAIALDHGKTPQSILRAVRAGFTHVMIDYAHKPIAENARLTQEIITLVRPSASASKRRSATSSSAPTPPANAPPRSPSKRPWSSSRGWTWTCWPSPTARRTASSRNKPVWISN